MVMIKSMTGYGRAEKQFDNQTEEVIYQADTKGRENNYDNYDDGVIEHLLFAGPYDLFKLTGNVFEESTYPCDERRLFSSIFVCHCQLLPFIT